MQFDDRLATVLSQRADGERTARTQFRQLVDLMARAPEGGDARLAAAAWSRLGDLAASIPAAQRAAILREPGTRLLNARIVFHFAEQEAEVAAAAMAAASLSHSGWEALIPRLPMRARGFLRLRRDLPAEALALLDRLGIHDRALPQPDRAEPARVERAQPAATSRRRPIPANDAEPFDTDVVEIGRIGAIRQRIETFRQSRAEREDTARTGHPRLPLGEAAGDARPALTEFAFTSDARCQIDWAEDRAAPMVRYAALAALVPPAAQDRLVQHQPLTGIELKLPGGVALAGDWVLDARPRFCPDSGRFEGYAGRFRRPLRAFADKPARDSRTDRLRQLLHELRTPVNAIQGFAEILQQQMFGAVPHEYRAHAASIASDSARILAGFDELDRLAKLESGEREIEGGEADFSAIVGGQARQLDAILRRRDAGFDMAIEPGLSVPIARNDTEALAWRLLATVAGTLLPGQSARLTLRRRRDRIRLKFTLPGRKGAAQALFETQGKSSGGPVTAGLFGAGFALRLARAEVQAVGGALLADGRKLILELPLLTASHGETSPEAPVGDAARS